LIAKQNLFACVNLGKSDPGTNQY